MISATIIQCACGKVECEGAGRPFLSAVCYCDDCQAAAREIEATGTGPGVKDADGGTALCLLRNDRFSISRGGEFLQPYRRNPDSPTSRMVAACCNSAMFLEFADGRFWKSVMTNRIMGTKPGIEMRLMTRYRDSALPWPDEVPRHTGFPISSLLRIGKQWLSMRLSPTKDRPAPNPAGV